MEVLISILCIHLVLSNILSIYILKKDSLKLLICLIIYYINSLRINKNLSFYFIHNKNSFILKKNIHDYFHLL